MFLLSKKIQYTNYLIQTIILLLTIIGFSHPAVAKDSLAKDMNKEKKLDEPTEPLDKLARIEKRIMSIVESRNPLKTIFVVSLEDVILKPANKEIFFSDNTLIALQERAISAVRESKLPFFNELLLTEYPYEIVDQRIVDLINKLQEKGLPVIIITSNTSGKFNKIPYLEEWTVNLLEKYGINLSQGQFAGVRLVMDKYPSKERGSYPTFFDGLLSCSSHKGNNAQQNVFTTLLVRFEFKPSTVIMLHHNISTLDIMKDQLKQMKADLEYWDFQYTYNHKEYNDQNPEEFLKFWKIYAKKLNSVSRGPSDSDAGNPYEEE